MKALSRAHLALLALSFAMGAGAAAFFIWPELFSGSCYITDVRQQPNWLAYHGSTFRPDDLLLRYSQFNESPVQNLLYYLGTFFVDGVLLGKLITILSFGCCSALFFLTCASLYGTLTGVLAALSFCFFAGQIEYFSSGFSKAWMLPLVFLGLFCLQSGRSVWIAALMPFGALAYPPAAVLTGLTATAYLALQLRDGRESVTPTAKALLAGSALTLFCLLPKYLSPPDFVGGLVPGHVLRAMPEMYKGGLAPYLPTPPLHEAVLGHLDHPFVLYSSLLFFFVLGRRKIGWDRTWTALFVASVVGYVLADALFMRMYIPNRYLRHSMAILVILWVSRNWALVIEELRRPWARRVALIAVVGFGMFLYRDDLRPGLWTMDRSRFEGVGAVIRTLPTDVLIAGHPRALDDVPIQGRRSALCTYKLSHPWFDAYYREIKARTYACLEATYAADVGPVNELRRRYGATHFLIDRHLLRRGARYRKPYNSFLREVYARGEPFVLADPPKASVVYEDERYVLLRLPLEQSYGQLRPGPVPQ